MNVDEQYEQSVAERIAGLEAEIAEKKIKLPPDIFKYVEDNILALQRISRERKMPTEKDMEFMEHVRMWLSLDEVDREKFTNIDAMLNNSDFQEATKRSITIAQYTACVEVGFHFGYAPASAEFSELFQFPGGGKIISGKKPLLVIDDYSGHFPDNWEFTGSLKLTAFQGDKLPKNFKVRENFDLHRCPNLKNIPDNFVISGSLLIDTCKSFESIGEGFRAGGHLTIGSCHLLEKFPSDFKVAGSLFCNVCSGLKEIPDNVNGAYFADKIDLLDCHNLIKLPSRLKTSRLNLKGCRILENLPDHLEVDVLDIHDCRYLKNLPNDIIIHDVLYLNNNPPLKVAQWVEKLRREKRVSKTSQSN